MHEMFLDYATLKVVWWALLGLFMAGFAVVAGVDMGVAALLPLLARTGGSRPWARAMPPLWRRGSAWLAALGMVMVAAWPLLFKAAFSGFCVALLLVPVALLVRPVGLGLCHRAESPWQRRLWGAGLFLGGVVPTLMFGVAFGNLFQGIPLSFDPALHAYVGGSFGGLFGSFPLVCGALAVAMVACTGALYIQLKAQGTLCARARLWAAGAALPAVALFAAGGFMLRGMDGHEIIGLFDPNGPANPLFKTVITVPGGWLLNYHHYPYGVFAPALGLGGLALGGIMALVRKPGFGFVCAALGTAGVVLTAWASLFPFLVPSSVMPGAGLTVWDASATQGTLLWLLAAVAVLILLAIGLEIVRNCAMLPPTGKNTERG